MLRYRNALAAAVASVLIAGFATNASALSPQVISETELTKQALTIGVSEPVVVNRADGQYRADGIPVALFAPDYQARRAAPRAMALEYLAARGSMLGLDAEAVANLRVTSERDDGSVGVVRVQQSAQGLPVYGSDIVVSTDAAGRVIFVANDVVSGIGSVDVVPAVTVADATAAAVAHLRGNARATQAGELMLYVGDGATHVVWRLLVVSDDPSIADWEVLVDAHEGMVLRAQSRSYNVDGTGTVFKPDPLSSARALYTTTGYGDNSNADSPQLTAQLFPVTLRDITFSGNRYTLEGPYAVCRDLEGPTDAGCPSNTTTDFSVTRSAMSFDGVNVYYHIDTYMRYVNVTLGVTAMPTRYYTGGVRFDPHGFSGQDNSRYSGGNLYFGQGGVDDAQDADVVIHELGHGIHDWVTNGGLSQVQGLSEGVGDYLAHGYSRDFPNQWTSADAQYNWMFNFDGHNEWWGGRVTNWQVGHSYPSNLGSPSPHIPGQYWASCNMLARDAIGGPAMDKAFLVGLSMTNSSSDQKVAAQAVVNAAAAQGANVAAIGQAYNTSCTYAVTVPAATDLIFKNSFEP